MCPLLNKAPVKAADVITTGEHAKKYQQALDAAAAATPAPKEVVTGRINDSSAAASDPSVSDRTHVGKLSVDSQPSSAPATPPREVGKLGDDRFAAFKHRVDALQVQIQGKTGKDATRDKRLAELKAQLAALTARLEEARRIFAEEDQHRKHAEELSASAIAGESRAVEGERSAVDNERRVIDEERAARENAESAAVMTAALGDRAADPAIDKLFAAGSEAAKEAKKIELYATHSITDDNAMSVILRLDSQVATSKDALFLCKYLIEDYTKKSSAAHEAATAARAAAERNRADATSAREEAERNRKAAEAARAQATEKAAAAERIMKELEAQYDSIMKEIAAMT